MFVKMYTSFCVYMYAYNCAQILGNTEWNEAQKIHLEIEMK